MLPFPTAMPPSRRQFILSAAAASAATSAATSLLRPCLAQSAAAQSARSPSAPTRINLAVIDRPRILAAATRALTGPPSPDAISALAAAAFIDPTEAPRYTTAAAAHLDTLLLAPATALSAFPAFPNFEPLLDRVPLAELAVALPFLALDATLLADLHTWFRTYLTFLNENRTALLARDSRSHHGSAWLLQVSAIARLLADDATLDAARHRYKTITVRAQIDSAGLFPHELPTDAPFRDSLFNLDLLAGVCTLLSTRFDSLWLHELQDGPGMRAAVACHARYIAAPATWPYRADRTGFKLLPGRRPALLLAARAFNQPDYATLFLTLPPDPAPDTPAAILRSFPIRQPILWQSQPDPPRL